MACGNPVDPSGSASAKTQDSSLTLQMNTRQESIDELNRIFGYFSKKAGIYDEYDKLQRDIKYLIKPQKGYKIVGIILLSIVFVFVCLALLMFDEGLKVQDKIRFFVSSFGPAHIMFITGLVLTIYGFPAEKKRKKKLDFASGRLVEVTNELSDYYSAFGPCVIGAEYSNPKIIDIIRGLVISGRADTPKEAINVMLDDAHKTHMQIQADLQTKALKSIKTTSAVTAGASVATAAFCGADLVSNLINNK